MRWNTPMIIKPFRNVHKHFLVYFRFQRFKIMDGNNSCNSDDQILKVIILIYCELVVKNFSLFWQPVRSSKSPDPFITRLVFAMAQQQKNGRVERSSDWFRWKTFSVATGRRIGRWTVHVHGAKRGRHGQQHGRPGRTPHSVPARLRTPPSGPNCQGWIPRHLRSRGHR